MWASCSAFPCAVSCSRASRKHDTRAGRTGGAAERSGRLHHVCQRQCARKERYPAYPALRRSSCKNQRAEVQDARLSGSVVLFLFVESSRESRGAGVRRDAGMAGASANGGAAAFPILPAYLRSVEWGRVQALRKSRRSAGRGGSSLTSGRRSSASAVPHVGLFGTVVCRSAA